MATLNPPPSPCPVPARGREARKRNPSNTSCPIWVQGRKHDLNMILLRCRDSISVLHCAAHQRATSEIGPVAHSRSLSIKMGAAAVHTVVHAPTKSALTRKGLPEEGGQFCCIEHCRAWAFKEYTLWGVRSVTMFRFVRLGYPSPPGGEQSLAP